MILGLDVSTSITGATILDKQGQVLYNEAWDTRKFKSFFEKVEYVEQQINNLDRVYGEFERVFIEESLQTFRSGFSSAATSARKLCGITVPRGTKAKEVVLKYILDNTPSVTIEYTKFGNPKPECYDKADSWVVARAGYTLCQKEKSSES